MPSSSGPLTRVSQLGIVNAYLVVENDGLTVVDTLMWGGGKALIKAAAAAGLPIRRIVLTHAHGDHVGGLDGLAAAVPEAEVIIGARDERLLRKDFTMEPGESQRKPSGSYPGVKTAITRTVVGGDRIGSLEVIDAPGHTPGHIALLDTRDRTLLCGDAFSTLGGVATSARANPKFPLPAVATWDKALELATARQLRALDPARLAPGHGPVVEAPGAAIDAAIAKAG